MSRNTSRLRSSTPSRPRNSRNPSVSSIPYIPQVEGLILPDGPVGEEQAELLQDFVNPHRHDAETTLIEEEEESPHDRFRSWAQRPWWKRPSPWWLIVAVPFSASAMGATIAPKVEIYTILACSTHRPEYTMHMGLSKQLGLPYVGDGNLFQVAPGPALGLQSIAFAPANATYAGNGPQIQSDGKLVTQNTSDSDADYPSRCASDPEVQAAVAKLSTAMSTSMGILSCITTVWWGALSDRYGRALVMGISILGLVLNDFNFIFVASFSQKLYGGYWLLLVGPIIEGLLGGTATGVAALHAYISDTTEPGARARIFSLMMGLLFTGVALGPALGGILLRVSGSVLSVFYAAAIMHLLYGILVWFILPEALTKEQMAASRTKHTEDIRKLKESREGIAVGFIIRIQRLFGFLSPLGILVPKVIKGRNPLKGRKRDWNLSLVAAAYGFTILVMGSYTFKLQYVIARFHWTSEIIGYGITIFGAGRAIYLAIVLPAIIRLLKPKAPPIQLPADADSTEILPSQPKEHHVPSFDLNLARVSIAIEVVAYALMAMSSSSIPFAFFTMVSSFGAGFSPAVQSVALELYTRQGEKETGRLFGALAVIQALSSSIIGPAIFGFTYIRTLKIFPAAIFYLSAAVVLVSFICLTLVRLSPESEGVADDVEEQTEGALPIAREETLVDLEPDLGNTEDRGRKSDTNTNANVDTLVGAA